ncbi:hypothetical protein [Tenacibaculum caenipelagi]|uniref:Uncharacterized protein n=1 Tax=Tenacibaculum caenipelagi TaxID=1325435 RepID=A0A4R6TDR4_9FLAO|nr:hypothetical protein [Tenacibaculum caenipelagi]TDQ27618.1 hypothetical protein DFQ07_1469 [Tenacibaculum caenipelagi]
MTHINPLEIKIIMASIAAAIVTPTDNIIRFLIPIVSGIVWVFLQPYVIKVRDKIKEKRRRNIK